MRFAPRRILVTGGSGFVGRHLCRSLAATYPEAVIRSLPVDVQDVDGLVNVVRAEAPEVCVHLAAVSTVVAAEEAEDRAWQVNLHGTLHLARVILLHAPTCHMLYVSSADAYGGVVPGQAPINEDTPLAPLNAYAATKAAADLALGSMVGCGLRVVRVRPFNHTGPGQAANFVVPAFARQIARIAAGLQEPRLDVGDLDSWRDFLDVRDVCAAYIACIDQRETIAPGTILNLCSGHVRRIGDVLKDMLSLAGVVAEIRTDRSRLRAVDVRRSFGDTARASAQLGWSPTTPWKQTLQDVLQDWRERVTVEQG